MEDEEQQTEELKMEFSEREQELLGGAAPVDLPDLPEPTARDGGGSDDEEEREYVPEAGDEPVVEAEETPESNWYEDEDVVELASRYGLTAEELQDLGDAKQFEKTIRILDARADKLRQTPEEAEQEQPEDDALLDPQHFRDAGFDEDSITLVENVNKRTLENRQLRSEVEMMKQVVYQQMLDQQRAAFHDSLDRLDGDFFGNSKKKLSKEQLDRRNKAALEAQKLVEPDLERTKKGVPAKYGTMDELCSRSFERAFPEAAAKRLGKQRAATLKRQAKQVRPVGAGANVTRRPSSKQSKESLSYEDQVSDLIENDELKEYWDSLQT